MAQKNTSGANTVPRLVVRIIGSKQVKQFIEEPQEGGGDLSERENPAVEAVSEDVKVCRSDRADSALWAVINKVPDRLCVTAPSGDRSRSYIHPKTPHTSEARAAAGPGTTEQTGVFEAGDKAELGSSVREQLCDWQLSALTSAEDEAAALDLTLRGTLTRPEVTHLFLKHDVPLKLPTFSLLLHMFADNNDPDQIRYRDLLQFMKSSAFSEQ